MTNLSISQSEMPIDENVKTAFVYSISDLFSYTVEIRYKNQSYFILNDQKESKLFGNLEDAKKAAKNEGSELAYLALDKTYQEVEADNIKPRDFHHKRYDYQKIF